MLDLTETRPCLQERLATCEAKWDFIARYSGRRSPEWIGVRLGMTAKQVCLFMSRHELGPTTRGDLLTTGVVADMLGCTQQWVLRLIKRGKLYGFRNPGGWWNNKTTRRVWLIPRHGVERYLRERGQPTDDVRLTEDCGWPQVILRKGGKRRAHRISSAHTLR